MDSGLLILLISIGAIIFFVFLLKAIVMWLFDIEKSQKLQQQQIDLLQNIFDRLSQS